MLTSVALNALKAFIKNTIAWASFKVGNTFYEAPLQSADILADGRVAITFLIDHTMSGNITITEVRLYDHNGDLWASKAENITRRAVQEGILYRFAFTITES